MKKKILSLALALSLVLALVPMSVMAQTENSSLVVDGVTVTVPGIPDMTIEMSNVFENYFYSESDGAVLFLFDFPLRDEETERGFYPIIFDRDIILQPMPSELCGMSPRSTDDVSVKAGEPIIRGFLSHCFTVDGVTVHFLGVDYFAIATYVYGMESIGFIGLAEELEEQGFVMRPISSITTGSTPNPELPLTDTTIVMHESLIVFNIAILGFVPDSTIMVAMYDVDGRLLDMKMSRLDNSKSSVQIQTDNPSNANVAKIMIWDGLGVLSPLDVVEIVDLE